MRSMNTTSKANWLHFLRNLFILLFVFSSIVRVAAQDVIKISTRTTDLTNTLSDTEKKSLDDQLYAIEQNTGRQVVIVMLPTTGSQSVEEYATALFRENKIGSKDQNDGVLILVAKEDHKMRIEVGYGLEGTITDLLADGIINRDMKPYFKDDAFYDGLNAAVGSIRSLLDGSASEAMKQNLKTADEAQPARHVTKDGHVFIFLILLSALCGVLYGRELIGFKALALLLVAGLVLGALMGRNPAILALFMMVPFPTFGGYAVVRYKKARIAALVLVAVVLTLIAIGKLFGADVVVFGLFGLFGLFFSGVFIFAIINGIKNGFSGGSTGSSSGWSSSDSSSWSSSSSSSSSFSGGGGSSGGGGASGSW
ncbi:MAG: TPM domain-containing protein [Niabella sp.]|nr:TPM domain-containing protein [Niabella sp.]